MRSWWQLLLCFLCDEQFVEHIRQGSADSYGKTSCRVAVVWPPAMVHNGIVMEAQDWASLREDPCDLLHGK